MTVTVGLLHPGSMGAPVGREAARNGARVLWSRQGRSPATAARADQAGLSPTGSLRQVVEAADIVVSVCPPAVAEQVAAGVAALGFDGLYVDANAISPGRMQRIAATLAATGAHAVDGAIIGPPPTAATRTRLYLAGAHDDVASVTALFTGSQVQPTALPGEPGTASALKMAYASFQKASQPLAALAHAIAARHGVTDLLTEEARDRLPGTSLADPDRLPDAAAKAWRWGPEMREVADTLRVLGLPADLALAAERVLRVWDSSRDDTDLTITETLTRLTTTSPEQPHE